MHRRDLLLAGVATGFALFSEQAFAQSTSGKVVPWADQPPPIPPPAQNAVHNLTAWESLDSWLTPNDKFFSIAHYNRPTIDAAAWRLNLSGAGQTHSTHAGSIEGRAAPRSDLHLGMLGNNGLPFAQNRRQRPMGGDEAG